MDADPTPFGSHDIGSKNTKGDLLENTCWRAVTGDDDDTDPDVLFNDLLPFVDEAGPFCPPEWPANTQVFVEIVVYQEGPASHINLNPEMLRRIAKHNIPLDVYTDWSTFDE